MKAKLEREFGTMAFKVWLFDPTPSGKTRLYKIVGSDTWEIEEVEPGSVAPSPSFTIQQDALKALVAEGMNLLPPDQAQARHLDDAIKVRDRLMDVLLLPRRVEA